MDTEEEPAQPYENPVIEQEQPAGQHDQEDARSVKTNSQKRPLMKWPAFRRRRVTRNRAIRSLTVALKWATNSFVTAGRELQKLSAIHQRMYRSPPE